MPSIRATGIKKAGQAPLLRVVHRLLLGSVSSRLGFLGLLGVGFLVMLRLLGRLGIFSGLGGLGGRLVSRFGGSVGGLGGS